MKIKSLLLLRLVSLISFVLFFLQIRPGISFAYRLENNRRPLPLIDKLSFEPPSPSLYPQNNNYFPPPQLSAQSALVLDVNSQVPLFLKNPNLKLPPASTTKIMTAVIVLENYDLNQIIKIGKIETDGAKMGLKQGDKISVRNLLSGMLLNSANDAAYILALNHPQGLNGFIKAMNEKAHYLNLTNSHFSDVTGLSTNNHFTTSLDLARLTIYALKNPLFAQTVATKEIIVFDQNRTHSFVLKNLNQLLGRVPGVLGVKTGFTEAAGECLVTLTTRNGQQIITVVLNSQDRFEESTKLIEWAFVNHSWIQAGLTAGT